MSVDEDDMSDGARGLSLLENKNDVEMGFQGQQATAEPGMPINDVIMAPGSPEIAFQPPAENMQIPDGDAHDEEIPNAALSEDILQELEPDVDPTTADPLKFDFGVAVPEFRPYTNVDHSGKNAQLCIKAITTENFKSFYGKKILGPFDRKFTAIVGPNGCGKSNTIDALLFVFGFRSNKLRAHKLHELIHTSAEHSACSFAKVTVHFVMIRSSTIDSFVQEPEFDIARSISAKNDSVYYLNGSRSSHHEIVAKLRQHGVDLDHNRFLILQGEVEQISLMKPTSTSEHEEGMLEYLEDIVGSNRYKDPIRQTEEVLVQLNGELESFSTVYIGMQKDLGGMVPQKKKAEEFLELQGNMFRLEYMLIQAKLLRLRLGIEKEKEKALTAQLSVEERKAALAELQRREKEWSSGQETTKIQLEELTSSILAAEKAIQKFEQEKSKLKQDLKGRKVVLTRLEAELVTLIDEKEALPEKIETDKKLQAEITQYQVGLETSIAEESAKFSVAQEKVQQSTKDLQATKGKLEKSLSDAVDKQRKATKTLDDKSVELNSVRQGAVAAESRVTEIKARLADAEKSVTELQTQQERDRGREGVVKAELGACEQKHGSLGARKKFVEAELSRIREQLGALRHTQQEDTRARSRDSAINELLQCKHSGIIEGILGRLGDLGAIDKKYELAVSAVTGRTMDMVVVDSVDASNLCVEHLKRSRKGRASIMVLQQIERQTNFHSMNSTRSYPERCPRLFDLIKLEDEALRPAFYYALRDTLVAENLDQADRVSKDGNSRHKVVTLIGQLIDTSGSMTGGGNPNHIEIRIGQKIIAHTTSHATTSNQAEIAALEAQSQRLQTELQEVTETFGESDLSLPTMRRELHDIQSRLPALTKNLLNQQKLVSSLPNDLQNAENVLATCSTNVREESRLKQEIEMLQTEAKDATALVDSIRAKIAAVDADVWDKRDEETRESEKKLKRLRKQLDWQKKELLELEAGILAAERSLASKELQIQKKKENEFEVTATVTALTGSITELETKRKSSDEELKKNRGELEDIKRSYEHLQRKVERTQEKIETTKTEIAELTKSTEDSQQLVRSLEGRAHETEPRLEIIRADAGSRQFAKTVKFTDLSDEELAQQDKEALKEEYIKLQKRIEKAHVNLTVLDDYAAAKRKFEEHRRSYREVKEKFAAATNLQKKLTEQRTEEFKTSFEVIRKKLKETYYILTLGGDAELEPVNHLNIFGDGIEFSVRPPNKSWKSISNLSGGEKTLSSLSLIFALHHYKPTPFYIMDEIDAALDYRNVTIVGSYIKDRAFSAQFVIVSLRPNMYQQAPRHIGIFKVNNSTQVCVLSAEMCRNTSVKQVPELQRHTGETRKHRHNDESETPKSRAAFKMFVKSLLVQSGNFANSASMPQSSTSAWKGRRKRPRSERDVDSDDQSVSDNPSVRRNH